MLRDPAKTSGRAKAAGVLATKGATAKAAVKPGKGGIAVALPSFRRERGLLKQGIWPVAGGDEAGRGPFAGLVVAAAVILYRARIPKASAIPSG